MKRQSLHAALAVLLLRCVIHPLGAMSARLGAFSAWVNEAMVAEIFGMPTDDDSSTSPRWLSRWLRTVYRLERTGSACRMPLPTRGRD